MKLDAEIIIRGKCKHCGEFFEFKEFKKHLAYEHEIYHSKFMKFKATIRKKVKKMFGEV